MPRCLLRLGVVASIAVMEFSQRYSAALDAYEACVIVDDLRKRIDGAVAWTNQLPDWPHAHFYVCVPSTKWYIESRGNATSKPAMPPRVALEHYRSHFWAASGSQPTIKDQVLAGGLPYPSHLRRASARARRLAVEPKWKQIVGGYQVSSLDFFPELPADADLVALNVPDPYVAITV